MSVKNGFSQLKSEDKSSTVNEKSINNIIVLSSRTCEHPEAPETTAAYRVKEYWSNLVIKPLTSDSQKVINAVFLLQYLNLIALFHILI